MDDKPSSLQTLWNSNWCKFSHVAQSLTEKQTQERKESIYRRGRTFRFKISLKHKCPDSGFWPCGSLFQVLLGFPRSLQPGGGAAVPGPGVIVSESPAGPPEERGQPDVTARLRPLLLLLPGEPQVRPLTSSLVNHHRFMD